MRTMRVAVVLMVALMIGGTSVAYAITNGEADAGRHPYVGHVVLDVDGSPPHRCSGALLSPTVFLTAGHCTDGTSAARVWFDEDLQENPEYPLSGGTSYDGKPHTHPDFCLGCGNGLPGFAIRDVGVVVLTEPVPTAVVAAYAQLPDAGLVDRLRNKTPVDLVGYGVQDQMHGGGPPMWTGAGERRFAPSELVSGHFVHSDAFMRIAFNPSGGSGGTCFEDSGGPNLQGGTHTVLAVNSYTTNANCSGVGYSNRVDIPEVLEWIHDFLE